jgi:hypothetical protein
MRTTKRISSKKARLVQAVAKLVSESVLESLEALDTPALIRVLAKSQLLSKGEIKRILVG